MQYASASTHGFDPAYHPDLAQEFQDHGLTGGRKFPTPEFVPDYAFRDPIFVMPPNSTARNLSFDPMDLADRQYYRDQVFAPPKVPRIPGR